MSDYPNQIDQSVAFIREHTGLKPTLALVLGSGLGDFAESFAGSTSIATSSVPHYPLSTVPGHRGRLVFASVDNTALVIFQGRIHLYESNNVNTVLYPIYIASKLGVNTLVVTNAAGGINRQFSPGDLMVITDQLDLTLEQIPAQASNNTKNAPLYDRNLTKKILEIARTKGIRVRQGVYAGVKGPSYETAAEVEMINRVGGDAVGMSTVLEVGLARC